MLGYVGLQLFMCCDMSDEVWVLTLCVHPWTLMCSELITENCVERVNRVLLEFII